ncbi:MAG: type I methionyl aminopeptidase [Clostridia bacterium]
MMTILSPAEIVIMKKACRITGDALKFAQTIIKPGISTRELDKQISDFILGQGATLSFKDYQGYPAGICASVNEVVVHGIPSDRVLVEGDIISIDVGALYKGFNGDAARTFPVGKISEEKQKLIDVTKQGFFEGIKDLKAGMRIGEISHKVQAYAESFGFSVVRELVGHGVGKHLHEHPSIPNYGKLTDGPIIKENVCLAIEPMINSGAKDIFVQADGWTIVASDKKPSAHYENTILVTKFGVEILTL